MIKDYLTPTQLNCCKTALNRILANQNKDGSWGNKKVDKITLTSQVIQLFLSLGIKKTDPVLLKAFRWVQDNIEVGEEHWITELEIDLKMGRFDDVLEDQKSLDTFLNGLNHDLDYPNEEAHLNFFWHIIPTLIVFLPHYKEMQERGIEIPFTKINEKIKDFCQVFGEDRIAVEHHPNYTGLIALYYHLLSDLSGFEKCKELSMAMCNWLMETRTENREEVFWLDSKSITSYVIIDLLVCVDDKKIEPLLSKVTKFLIPNKKGIVGGDTKITYNTKLHSDPLYITILALRAISEIENFGNADSLRKCINEIKKKKHVFFAYRFSKFISKNLRKIPLIISFVLTICGIILYTFDIREAAQIIVSTGVAGALGIFFDWIFGKDR